MDLRFLLHCRALGNLGFCYTLVACYQVTSGKARAQNQRFPWIPAEYMRLPLRCIVSVASVDPVAICEDDRDFVDS
jgi:hypothetical protein